MAVFNPSTGTIKSTTIEGAFLEILRWLVTLPKVAGAPSDVGVTYTINPATGLAEGTFTLPCTFDLDSANGRIETIATEIFQQPSVDPYMPATGGTLKSNGLVANFIEMAYIINSLPAKAGLSQALLDTTGVTITINQDAGRIAGSYGIPVTLSATSTGATAINAVEIV
jgi:hypothetical protein